MPNRSLTWRRAGTPETGFTYLRADGRPLRDRAALSRIAALAIPPAWTEVRISADAKAPVQATGLDAAGRTQYRYHPETVRRRANRKYRRLLAFARLLPRLRAATHAHLRQSGLGREKVLATMVRLMTRGFFRVGSERYAVENKTFGIATLRKRNLTIEGNDLRFRYVGKKSIHQHNVVADTPLVEIVRELLRLPGTRLFRYMDADGEVRNVTAADVNAYLREILGGRYTSKDIRTWGGTVRAATVLADLGPARSEAEAKRNVVLACKLVAAELGNTPTVCRSAYIHPIVLEKYLDGKTVAPLARARPRARRGKEAERFYPEEEALIRFLERWS